MTTPISTSPLPSAPAETAAPAHPLATTLPPADTPATLHRRAIRNFGVDNYESLRLSRLRNAYFHRYLARIISHHVLPNSRILDVGCASGDMLVALHPVTDTPADDSAPKPAAHGGVGIDINPAAIADARSKYPTRTFLEIPLEELTPDHLPGQTFDYIILSGVLPQLYDLHTAIEALRPFCHDRTRLIIATFSRLWHPIIRFGELLGRKARVPDESWMPPLEVRNLISQCDFAILRQIHSILCPVGIPFLANFINRWIAPLPFINQLSLCTLTIARPLPSPAPQSPAALPPLESITPNGASAFNVQRSRFPSISIIVPARNEAGNIAPLLARIPRMARQQEVIFIEGHSTDDTWEVIQKVVADYQRSGHNGQATVPTSPLSASVPQRLSAFPSATQDSGLKTQDFSLSALKQTGRGKGDAVRSAFAHATGDILIILDADLSVPPEELPRFIELLARGQVEFANGSRLVYPMEKQAMQTLNLIANKFFGHAFTWLLGQNIRDTLCGTKALRRTDHLRIAAHRAYFGDFDPFGDFDLLFGAARLNLKIQDVPVHYKQRTYGSTNISRFRHGLLLFRMCTVAARKLKFI